MYCCSLGYRHPALFTVLFETGLIYLMKSIDDPMTIVIETNLSNANLQWNVTGEYLVVVGHTCQGNWSAKDPLPLQNYVKFYTRAGTTRLVCPLDLNEVCILIGNKPYIEKIQELRTRYIETSKI